MIFRVEMDLETAELLRTAVLRHLRVTGPVFGPTPLHPVLKALDRFVQVLTDQRDLPPPPEKVAGQHTPGSGV